MKPTTSTIAKNTASFSTSTPTSPACNEPVLAKPDSNASITMPRMSSITRMPKMTSANASRVLPSSLSALMMIVVDEIDSIAPRNTLSIVFQPKSRPTS